MPDRDKDVMIYHYDPKKKIYLVSLQLENKPGALGNLADLLGIRGMNILEGYFGGMSYGPKATVSFFVESTNQRLDEGWLKEYVESSIHVSNVEVKAGIEGFLADSLNFPLTWNNGDRAVLMRIEGVRAMLDAVKFADSEKGEQSVYNQGLSYGKVSWAKTMSIYHPKTKEGLAEMLEIYAATGWGRPELTDLDVQRRRAKVRFRDNFECVDAGTGRPASHFIRGHLAGAMSVFFGSDVKALETKCISKGDSHCEFEMSA